jgi:hypothetical protein
MVSVTVGTQEILTFRTPGGRQFRFVVMSNTLATSNKTIFQDGWSYACTLLLAIVYERCFLFRNVDMATATTQCCNICDHDNESKLAATWCPECEDFLCTDCNRHHSRSSSTKQHIVISKTSFINYCK